MLLTPKTTISKKTSSDTKVANAENRPVKKNIVSAGTRGSPVPNFANVLNAQIILRNKKKY